MNHIQGRMRRATVADIDPVVEMLQKEMQEKAHLGNAPRPINDEHRDWVSPRVLAKRQAIAAWVSHSANSKYLQLNHGGLMTHGL